MKTSNGIEHEELIQYINKYDLIIKKFAHKYQNTISSWEDLYSEGVLALTKYLPKIKSKKDIDEIPYISEIIRRQIMCRAIETSYLFHFPSGSYCKFKELKTIDEAIDKDKFCAEYGKNTQITHDFLYDMIIKESLENIDGEKYLYRAFIEGVTLSEMAQEENTYFGKIKKKVQRIRDDLKRELEHV